MIEASVWISDGVWGRILLICTAMRQSLSWLLIILYVGVNKQPSPSINGQNFASRRSTGDRYLNCVGYVRKQEAASNLVLRESLWLLTPGHIWSAPTDCTNRAAA